MKNILVTGGAGFIGSHAAKMLYEMNLNPIVVDSLEHGHRDAVLTPLFYKVDLTNTDQLKKIFESLSVDAVMHFAGYLSVPESMTDPDRYYRNNLQSTLSLLTVMREFDCRKIIFSSSSAVYGEAATDVILESHPTQPVSPYGHSKLIIEQMLRWYFHAYGIDSISLRYFCAAGADRGALLGERHPDEIHLIPRALHAAMTKEPFTVFGTDYLTPDGSCIRDFIHVEDIVDAHIRSLRLLEKEHMCTAINIGTGKGFSVLEILGEIEKVTQTSIHIVKGPRRLGDPSKIVAAYDEAHRLLGWEPQFSDIYTIIGSAFNFYQKIFPALTRLIGS